MSGALVCVLRQASPPIAWPPVFTRKAACVQGFGMAVDAARGVVVVSGLEDNKLYVYSLADGSLVRSFGGEGSGKGQFYFSSGYGGLCMTPRGTVLVAESKNNRLQEVNVDDGGWVRFVGDGLLEGPDYVACSESVIAVTETVKHRVALLSWADGSLLARFGSYGSGDWQLEAPCGLRFLDDGSGVVVADKNNHRLCIFSMAGAFVRSLPADRYPRDVVECDSGDGFVVANWSDGRLSKVSAASGVVAQFGKRGSGNGEFDDPVALATVQRDKSSSVELVVLDKDNRRLQVFRG